MSALTSNLGEVLVGVTEDQHRILLHFENGSVVCIEPKAPDSRLEATEQRRRVADRGQAQ